MCLGVFALIHEVAINPRRVAFVNVHIRPYKQQVMVPTTFKVDTGADCTTISSEQLLKLGYDEDWIKSGRLLVGDERPTVVSGLPLDGCYRVILPEIQIGEWVGYNWPVLTNSRFRTLLGTDSMQFFNWTFDYEHNVCRFSLIPNKRKILFRGQEQSIHEVEREVERIG